MTNDNFFKDLIENLEDIVVVNASGVPIYCNGNEKQKILDRLIYNGNNIYIDAFSLKTYQKVSTVLSDEYTIERYADVTKLNEVIYRYGMDCLTKMPIRIKIDEYFQYIQQANNSFIVAMIDIDDFKKVNDNYGHDVGDEVLASIANVILSNITNNDFAGRYGGEEFILLLEIDNKENAISYLNDIRRQINDLSFNAKDDQFHVSVSIGVAEFLPGNVLNNVIKEADDALYYIKKSGKNAVGSLDNDQKKYVKYIK